MASDSDIVPVEVPVVHIDSVAMTGCSLLEAARIVTEIADFDIEYCVLLSPPCVSGCDRPMWVRPPWFPYGQGRLPT